MRPAIQFIKDKFKDTPLIGVEVGVKNGSHAQNILDNLIVKHLYLIDSWVPYIEEGKIIYDPPVYYDHVVKKFGDNPHIEIIRTSSCKAAKGIPDKHLDFVYIDGCHQYEYVYSDIAAWFPKLKVGGVLSGHDYGIKWGSVNEAVNDYFSSLPHEIHSSPESDWWVVKKCKETQQTS